MATKQISLLRKLQDVAWEAFDEGVNPFISAQDATIPDAFEEGFKAGFDAASFLIPRCADELRKNGCPEEMLLLAVMMALADIRIETIHAGGDDEKTVN